MTIVYVPVFKTAVSYTVNIGRRWSIIEQILLLEVTREKRSILELAQEARLPSRLVAEALINLLRAGLVEVRVNSNGVVFAATSAGERRANDEELPARLYRDVRWISLCVDRIAGGWFRSDELELVYIDDLPLDARILPEVFDRFYGRELPRELLFLRADEVLEPAEPVLRTPSRPYARVPVGTQRIQGLPNYAPLDLLEKIRREGQSEDEETGPEREGRSDFLEGAFDDELTEDDLIVGGSRHEELLRCALGNAGSTVVVHSCFIDAGAIEKLAPDLQAAAERGVRIEMVWGLYADSESNKPQVAIAEASQILCRLPERAKSKVKLSTVSSRSHAKILLYDRRDDGTWEMVLGSCNFLSSWFNLTEVSVRFRNTGLISTVLSRLIATQQPASGAWPPMTVRLNRLWSRVRSQRFAPNSREFTHSLRLLADSEHYVCVTQMRDEAIKLGPRTLVEIGCDLYGSTAETTVLTPMTSVARHGGFVSLFYRRTSKYLIGEGIKPDAESVAKRNIEMKVVDDLHGKFVIVGEDIAVISSFNWLSSAVEGTRTRSAELGLIVRGPSFGSLLRGKLAASGLTSKRKPEVV